MTDRSVIAYPAILNFSESRHYIREVNPANTMAYDRELAESLDDVSVKMIPVRYH